MANPSTTGSGTEVIRRFYYDGTGETLRSILTVSANHIYIVKTLIICERNNHPDTSFTLDIDVDGSGTLIQLVTEQTCGSKGTFIWDNVFVMSAGDILKFTAQSSGTGDYDIVGTYIDQDWS